VHSPIGFRSLRTDEVHQKDDENLKALFDYARLESEKHIGQVDTGVCQPLAVMQVATAPLSRNETPPPALSRRARAF
jgi:hypothetical protein